ncbi:MAG: acetate--CoA ligase [Crocinitomicaceae bacterium]|nr:acetate--CoA ligase [Crocinitomicaceae bacterium]MBK8926017.1 acetate--CoA ligase [Crocinitomicaceae bacterium]
MSQIPFYQIRNEEEYLKAYQQAVEHPENFWNKIAESFLWRKKWDKTLDWEFTSPSVQWFCNGKLNITENVIDRHLPHKANDIALIWEPNNPTGKGKKITWSVLRDEVNRFSNILVKNNIQKGDRVCIYLPMIPEAVYAMLACARVGAVHSVVFAGFSARALSERVQDAGAKMIITSDGLVRGDKKILLRDIVQQAVENCPSIETILTVKHTGDKVKTNHLDKWYHEEYKNVSAEFTPVETDSEDPLFILYTSGSTGKPKGVVHTCGGYMVYADYSFRNVFQPEKDDIFWCTADVGWVTGHTYIAYAPLLAGTTCVLFEGVPNYPDTSRFWQVIEKIGVTQFYTAPTAIRSLMMSGPEVPEKFSMQTLKIIGSVGEPINLEAWQWYHDHVGKKRCPVVDTWWQTETGGIMISGLGKTGKQIPTYAGRPLPGIQPVLLTPEGKEITENNAEGLLAIKFPWPSILRTTWDDHERCRQTYFSSYKGYYFTGDGARKNADGMFRIIGRVDDVINVSGHRLGTAEIENAINEHPSVIESAVVGFPHDIKGQGIYGYVICDHEPDDLNKVRTEIHQLVETIIGKIARPDKIQFVTGLPKTRSGKIMRRILRKIAEGNTKDFGDTSTLLDPAVVELIVKGSM